MNYTKLLKVALTDSVMIDSAAASLAECKRRASGSTWKKWKVRLFKAGWIADQLAWSNNRLIEVHPDLLDMDIEPVTKVSSNGDNGPWDGAPGHPIEDCWLNEDTGSAEYRDAVNNCYWSRGNHPRSKQARKDWYRRNAGAGYVYRVGCPVDEIEGLKIWRGRSGRTDVVVFKSGDAWQMHTYTKLIGNLKFMRRIGFEVDNVFSGTIAAQAWFAIDALPVLKAPVSWTAFWLTTKAVYERKDNWPGVEQTAAT